MLENFIFSHQKTVFEEALNNNEVSDEAIVFIEDTKEIWNHGTYFDGSTFDSSNIEASIQEIKDKTDLIKTNDDGTKFLSDDGTYKEVNTSVTVDLTNSSITEEKYNEMCEAINNYIPINVLIYNEAANNFIGLKQSDVAMDPGGNIHLYYTMFNRTDGTTNFCVSTINSSDYSVNTRITPINNLEPYYYNTMESTDEELLEAINSGKNIIVIGANGGQSYGNYYIDKDNNTVLQYMDYYNSETWLPHNYIIGSGYSTAGYKELKYYNNSNTIRIQPNCYSRIIVNNDCTIDLSGYTPVLVYESSAEDYCGELEFNDTVYNVNFRYQDDSMIYNNIKWTTFPNEFKPNTTYQFRITHGIGNLLEVGKGEVAYKSDLNSGGSDNKLIIDPFDLPDFNDLLNTINQGKQIYISNSMGGGYSEASCHNNGSSYIIIKYRGSFYDNYDNDYILAYKSDNTIVGPYASKELPPDKIENVSNCDIIPNNYYKIVPNQDIKIYCWASNIINDAVTPSAVFEGQIKFDTTVYNVQIGIRNEYGADYGEGKYDYQKGITHIIWSTDSVLDFKPKHTYQFRIVNGFGVMKEFANAY